MRSMNQLSLILNRKGILVKVREWEKMKLRGREWVIKKERVTNNWDYINTTN